jgi:hypothetical protein
VQKNVGKEFHIENIVHIRNGQLGWYLRYPDTSQRRSVWVVQS